MSRDESMIRHASAEGHARPDYFMHLQLPLPVLVSVVAHLQIAIRMRPAQQRGASTALVRDTIDKIIERLRDDGFRYNADYLEVGTPRDTEIL
jgi:hypothetical protein